MRLNKTSGILLIAICSALLFLPFLGRVHLFDWDEINFAECSREMIKLDDYTRVYVDYKPFWEKPPMFFWMQSTAMKVFWRDRVRRPPSQCHLRYRNTDRRAFSAGSRIYDQENSACFGPWRLAALSFPICISNRGSSDPWFNLFTFLSLYNFYPLPLETK